MPVPDEVWFVQMRNVGTFLGPMPLDALIEMARTGVLLRRDLVRRDASDPWQSAYELPELSGEFAASVPSEEAAEIALSDNGPLTLPDSHTRPESTMVPAAVVPVDSIAFTVTSPSADVIAFPSEPPQSAEPVSTPTETTHTSASVAASDSTLDETVAANPPAWSEPVPALHPIRPRNVSAKPRRGPSALARFFAALPEFLAWFTRPIDKRLVATIAVLALLAWYFFPSAQPVRRPPPKTAEVAGVIRFNGKPVSNALVLFRPDRSQGTIGPPSMGQTDAAGQFQLTINNTHTGAVVGKHQIAVRTREFSGSSEPSMSVPTRYAQVETSRLVADVLPDQLNEITLDLTSN